MLKREFYQKRPDGIDLYRTYSDENYRIRQMQTNTIYDEAIDIENTQYTYEETDEKIEREQEEILEPITITENGTYLPREEIDGFNKVTVDVNPELEDISVKSKTGNRQTITPRKYGFRNITVMPFSLQPKTIIKNGEYEADYPYDGLGKITVNVPELGVYKPIMITENGHYIPEEDVNGYNPVTVNVQAKTESIEINENGTYVPSEEKDGFNRVIVDVPPVIIEPTTEPITIQQNGIYLPREGVDGFDRVTVDIESETEAPIEEWYNLIEEEW